MCNEKESADSQADRDGVTEGSIRKLVDAFYSKVRADEELGPIFHQSIGTDDRSWEKHLRLLYDFWSSIMLTTGRYHGNPHRAHRELPPFDPRLFDRWLELFAETAHEVHGDRIAQKYVDRSHRIAQSLILSMQDRGNR